MMACRPAGRRKTAQVGGAGFVDSFSGDALIGCFDLTSFFFKLLIFFKETRSSSLKIKATIFALFIAFVRRNFLFIFGKDPSSKSCDIFCFFCFPREGYDGFVPLIRAAPVSDLNFFIISLPASEYWILNKICICINSTTFLTKFLSQNTTN